MDWLGNDAYQNWSILSNVLKANPFVLTKPKLYPSHSQKWKRVFEGISLMSDPVACPCVSLYSTILRSSMSLPMSSGRKLNVIPPKRSEWDQLLEFFCPGAFFRCLQTYHSSVEAQQLSHMQSDPDKKLFRLTSGIHF